MFDTNSRLCRQPYCSGRDVTYLDGSLWSVTQSLASFKSSQPRMTELRGLLAVDAGAGEASRMSDEDVVERVASLLVSHRLHVHLRPEPRPSRWGPFTSGKTARQPEHEFTSSTKKEALKRQENRCASCGKEIAEIGEAAREKHEYGERAEAHHIRPVQSGGSRDVDNCVIICQACHYSVHGGGDYRSEEYPATPADFEFYNG